MIRGTFQRFVSATSLFLVICCYSSFSLAFLPLTRRSAATRRGLSVLAAATIDANNKPLIPEESPNANVKAVSLLSGVRFSSVLNGLHRLYPPEELSQRNAWSRTDGYWPYIQKGQDPPQHLTYGEFDFYFLAELLDRAHSYYSFNREQHQPEQQQLSSPPSSTATCEWTDKVFVDIGSGTGRLVLSAAALHPTWRACRGIELLPTIHDAAKANLEKCRVRQPPAPDVDEAETTTALPTFSLGYNSDPVVRDDSTRSGMQEPDGFLPMAPIEFVCGSFEDPYIYLGDADCIFVFSTCMGEGLRASLAQAIGRQCKPGTVVITTDYMLPLEGTIPPVETDDRVPSGPFKLKLVEKKEGFCWLTGESTAYIHQVVESQWQPGQQPLERRVPSIEDVAFETVMALESGELADTDAFLRGVSNNIIFHGLPETFLPDT